MDGRHNPSSQSQMFRHLSIVSLAVTTHDGSITDTTTMCFMGVRFWPSIHPLDFRQLTQITPSRFLLGRGAKSFCKSIVRAVNLDSPVAVPAANRNGHCGQPHRD